MDLRCIRVLIVILIFGVSYSSALYISATVKFLDVLMMNAWRDSTFIIYTVLIAIMALKSKGKIEKDFIGVAIFYLALIFIFRIIGYFIAMPDIVHQLIFINGVTFILSFMVLISSLRHGFHKY